MRVVLTLTLDIDDSGDPENAEAILHENLGQLVQRAMGEGMITSDSELVVDSYESRIQVVK